MRTCLITDTTQCSTALYAVPCRAVRRRTLCEHGLTLDSADLIMVFHDWDWYTWLLIGGLLTFTTELRDCPPVKACLRCTKRKTACVPVIALYKVAFTLRAALRSGPLRGTAQRRAAPRSAAQRRAALRSAARRCAASRSAARHCTALPIIYLCKSYANEVNNVCVHGP